MFGTSLLAYWPLNETSGTVATDKSGNGRNGAYVNGTLGAAGIGDGGTAFSLDGTSDAVNVYSADLATNFPYTEGGISFMAKSPLAMWTDATARYWAIFQADTSNRIMIRRETTNNTLAFYYIAGGVSKSWTLTNSTNNTRGFSKSDWINYAFTWSVAAGTAEIYINGALFQTLTSIGTWTGSLAATNSALGAANDIGAASLSGTMAHVLLVNRKITALEARTIYNQSPLRNKIIAILGDSISNESTEWPFTVYASYNSGNSTIVNHAVAGDNILASMDAQTLAAATDNADVIVIALGTNDDNAGNMATLQAEAEENIAELKASNPNATIYWMNVLPRWTDSTGATPVDKSNIRTAIAAACTAQSITCIDTFSTPWITAAQTADGLHPTVAGHAAIAAQILARI